LKHGDGSFASSRTVLLPLLHSSTTKQKAIFLAFNLRR
jgi:hypothetical protein